MVYISGSVELAKRPRLEWPLSDDVYILLKFEDLPCRDGRLVEAPMLARVRLTVFFYRKAHMPALSVIALQKVA